MRKTGLVRLITCISKVILEKNTPQESQEFKNAPHAPVSMAGSLVNILECQVVVSELICYNGD